MSQRVEIFSKPTDYPDPKETIVYGYNFGDQLYKQYCLTADTFYRVNELRLSDIGAYFRIKKAQP